MFTVTIYDGSITYLAETKKDVYDLETAFGLGYAHEDFHVKEISDEEGKKLKQKRDLLIQKTKSEK